MNTTQLSRSIARHLDVPDSSNLESDALFDVLNAINSGLHLFFTEAPAHLKRTTFSATFRAPVTLGLQATSQYSTDLVGTPFDASWYGCGVNIQGMPSTNEIVGVSSLLDQWISPTLTGTAQVLFDSQPLPVTIERLTSDVRAYSNAYPNGRVLKRHTSMLPWRRLWGPWIQPRDDGEFYRIEPTAIIAGGNTVALLRIHPAPIIDTIVRFEAEISAASISASDLISGASLPVADAWAPLLIPLCEEALTYSPLWKDPKSKVDVRQNCQNIIANRIKKLPQDMAVTGASIGTPWGY